VGNRTRKGQASDLARVIRKGGAPLDALNLGHLRQLYDSEIRFWDAQLAALLEGLAELGLRGNTILIITADHGEEFQEHGLLGHGAHLFDESIRVPFVIVGPTLVGPTLEGARSNIPAQGIDLFPTVAGLLGFSPPANLPGQDLLAQARARPVFSETGYGRTDGATDVELVAVRWSNWKLIQAPGLRKSSLFNLRRDSAERTDLFGTEKVAAPLSRFLDEWRASVPPPPAVQAQDPGLHDKLEALGYVD
jgi:arylsulfatase A-like enzyme